VQEMARLVVEAGGRFYLAKDSLLTAPLAQAAFGHERLARFAELKHSCDPDNILQTDLSRRLFGSFTASHELASQSSM